TSPLSPSISLTRKPHFRAARGSLSLRGARAAFSPDRALCPCRIRRYSSRSSPDISYTVLHFPAVVNRLQLDDLAPVEVAALEAVDQHLGRRDIRRDRDVVHVAKAQKVLVVRRFRLLRLHGIAEKQQEVDLIAGDARRN